MISEVEGEQAHISMYFYDISMISLYISSHFHPISVFVVPPPDSSGYEACDAPTLPLPKNALEMQAGDCN